METIAQEAKRLLEPIPEDQWMINDFTDYRCKCCVIGHYERLKSGSPNNFSFENCSDAISSALREQSRVYFTERGYEWTDIADVNNETSHNYHQPTPKQRVMALLDNMIAAGY